MALNPADAENLSALGVCYLVVGEREKSAAVLTRALELKPDDADTRYWLAAAGVGETPESMSAKAVTRLFDGYAGHFDEHLVGKLQYRTPALIGAALRRARSDREQPMAVLDLGCGTGLMGEEIKDIATYLAGVDLSPKMIERASVRGLYDELAVGDITEYMEASSRHFDVIVSADVFVYLGKIDQVFAATSACLSPGGLFAFSVEAHAGDRPFELRSSGRYAHALYYLRELAGEHGFSEVSVEEVTLRLENNVPIAGYVIVLRRS